MLFLSPGGAEYLRSLSLLSWRPRIISVELICRRWLGTETEEDEAVFSRFSLLMVFMSTGSKENTILNIYNREDERVDDSDDGGEEKALKKIIVN